MPAAAARWIVPAAVTALVVGGGVAASASSDGVPDLPERSAADLLVAISEAEPVPFSGVVHTAADLGLPDLSGITGAAGASESPTDPASALMGLATGENSLRVWVGGPEQQRVSVTTGDFAELDVRRDGDVAWTYSSAENTATRYDLAAMAERAEAAAAEHAALHGTDDGAAAPPAPPALPEDAAPFAEMTPDELARTLLADVDETTEVTVGEAQVVAGRDAYTLVATPRDDATLVGGIEVAVDAETGLVLLVQVNARGQEAPAFVTKFSDLELETPAADVFAFTPAAGTTVVDALEEIEAKADEATDDAADETAPELPDQGMLEEMFAGEDAPEPVVHGEGWSTVVELTLPTGDLPGATEGTDAPSADVSGEDASPFGDRGDRDGSSDDVDPAELLGQLTTAVDGGQVFTTALVTVLLTDDGRVLLGSVDAATLQSYAG